MSGWRLLAPCIGFSSYHLTRYNSSSVLVTQNSILPRGLTITNNVMGIDMPVVFSTTLSGTAAVEFSAQITKTKGVTPDCEGRVCSDVRIYTVWQGIERWL